jgi:VWFA-related protein
MKKLLFGLLVAFFSLAGYSFKPEDSISPTQQDHSQLRHEVKVTLKLVQVYVTDKKGNPVINLEKNDFVVFDEGKEQKITEFERHVLSIPSRDEAEAEIVETPAQPGRELMPRKFFLFFDFAFNNGLGIEKARNAALHFIDTQLQPQDEVGLLSYSAMKSLTLHEYLTTDHQKVREVARKFRMEQIAGRAEDFEVEYWQAVTGENPKDASKSGGVFDKEDASAVRRDRRESENQTLQFAQKMIDLSKALRYIPGHKHIVLFSSGVPYSIIYGSQSPYGHPAISDLGNAGLRFKYEDMLKELSAANCAIYALDTQELLGAIDRDATMQGRYTLEKMAGATGGKYFGNINNYERHIEKIQDLTGCYYVLGYYVDDKWDGAYHKIKVEVAKPGYKVHAQKGYFNPTPFGEYSDLERMLHLVDLALSEEPLFQTPIRFPLEVVPCSSEGKANLCLTADIPLEKIKDLLSGKVEVIGVIFDEKENIVTLKRNRREATELSGERFQFSASFTLPQGTYKCRLVIRNLETGKGAVASATAVISSR